METLLVREGGFFLLFVSFIVPLCDCGGMAFSFVDFYLISCTATMLV